MPKIRNIIIFVAIFIIIILIYVYFIKAPSDTSSLVTTSPVTTDTTVLPNTADATVADDFLNLLLSVKSIKLEDSIFADDAFNSLHDSSIVLIPDGTEGRPNPFAPFGNDNIPPALSTPATTTSTFTTPASPTTPATTTSPTTPSSTIQFPASGTPAKPASTTPVTTPPTAH